MFSCANFKNWLSNSAWKIISRWPPTKVRELHLSQGKVRKIREKHKNQGNATWQSGKNVTCKKLASITNSNLTFHSTQNANICIQVFHPEVSIPLYWGGGDEYFPRPHASHCFTSRPRHYVPQLKAFKYLDRPLSTLLETSEKRQEISFVLENGHPVLCDHICYNRTLTLKQNFSLGRGSAGKILLWKNAKKNIAVGSRK